MQQFDFFRK
jgi:hypothetical protein